MELEKAGGGDEAGELVETGSFRVDAGRMTEVLAKYQLRRPEEFLHALTRAAVAAGATRAGIRSDAAPKGTGIVFSFDACPYGGGAPDDLFGPLLEGGRGAGRYFAAGLLALTRTAPVLLEVCTAGARYELDGPHARRTGEAPDKLTTVRCLWSRNSGPAGYSRTYLMSKCLNFPSSGSLDCCPIPVQGPRAVNPTFSGRRAEDGRYAFEKAGRYGFMSPRCDDGEPYYATPSRARVYVHGVLAESYELPLPAPVLAEVNDDSLNLDISQGSCLQDGAYSALERFLEEGGLGLAAQEIKRQRGAMTAVGLLLRQRPYRQLWRARLGYAADWAAVSGRPGPLRRLRGWWRWLATAGSVTPWAVPVAKQAKESGIPETGLRTIWLRDMLMSGQELRQGLSFALKETPLMFSVSGEPLTPAEILRRAASGKLKVSHSFEGEAGAPEHAVWLASHRDTAFLRTLVPAGRWAGVFAR